MQLLINDIKYQDQASSNARLISYSIPKEGETYEFIFQDNINKQNYPLSTRNGSGAYNVPITLDKVYLNYIPRKVYVSDSNLSEYNDSTFGYFVEEILPEPEKFTLIEGQIFRCVGQDSTPKPKEAYTYYIIQNSKKKKIPNYKTLEVMLAERNESLLSVKVIQEQQCQDIPLATEEIPDKASSWNESFSDKTTTEVMQALDKSVKDGAAIADAAKKSADQQIAAVQAKADQSKAEANAAKAKSEADKAAADKAIAEANAAKAQAEQAKAEADAKAAELNSKS